MPEIKHEAYRPSKGTEHDRREWPKDLAERLSLVEIVTSSTSADNKAYVVYLDHSILGQVQSFRIDVPKKHGRIIYGYVGHPKVWRASRNNDRFGEAVGYQHDTRDRAIVALVNRFLET